MPAAPESLFAHVCHLLTDPSCDRWPEAEALWQDRRQEAPEDPEVLAVEGEMALRRDYPGLAVALLEQAVAGCAAAAPVAWLASLAMAYRLAERPEHAIATYRRLLSQDPRHVDGWNALGILLRDLGRTSEAVAAFEALIRVKPSHAGAIRRLGTCLQQGGDPAGAEAAYRRAIAVKPDYIEAYTNLGQVREAQGDAQGALDAFRTAVSLKRDFAPSWYALGQALVRRGRRDEAITALTTAVDLYPWYADAHRTLLELGYRWA